MASTTKVVVPDIGDFDDVPIIEVLVHKGDRVSAEDPLITLESDKATMDVPAPQAGVVKEIKVSVGDKVSEGTDILILEIDGEAARPPGGNGASQQDTPAEMAEPPPQPEEKAPAVRQATAGGTRIEEVRVPDIGDFSDVPVIEVLVKVGDSVKQEDALVTLESDKATMDVPSPFAGTVKELKVSVGDKVSEGAVILTMEASAGATGAESKPAEKKQEKAPEAKAEAPREPAPAPSADVATRPSPTAAISTDSPPPKSAFHATPAVRRFARELGVDLSGVRGTGRKGRILNDDIKRFIKETLARPAGAPGAGMGIAPIPAVDFSKFGEIETRPLPRIKKISGPFLHRAWLNVPHVTHHDETDVTELEEFRKSLKAEGEKKGVRITALAFITKAVATTLAEFPSVNASLTPDGESLVYKKYFHIGIAMDTPNGLVVPVLRDVDKKGIFDLAKEMGEISGRAREGKLKPNEMQGGCISISSLGGIGGTAFTPIVNAPEVAILGVTRARMMPVWNGKEFVPRLMLPLDLSYDHRVIDGAEAARFMAYLCGLLGDLRRLLL
ncbi:MAG: dihydrolipoyllysine-residue acetyltransferase [Gammaproteobacteria bacterium]|nr:dihydrolipoyllysine-residue acetyltransferase [Gammaproteobacteria bacterium]MDH3413444.1 dihydrolipoyllysine-residue acetyltransferase [Gammaproteobacteria bacterium]